jgi:hypothetical protein
MSDPWLEQFEKRRAERAATNGRSFVVAGETLTVKPTVAPQIATRYWRVKVEIIDLHAAREEATKKGLDPPLAPRELENEGLLELFDDTMTACLESSSLEAYKRLRSADLDNPLDWEDLFALCEGVLAKASGIPTAGPSDSSDGPPNAKPSSKARSGSRAATRKP